MSSYTRKPLKDSNENDYTSSYSRRSIRSSALGDDDGDSLSYSRKPRSGITDDDGDYTSSYKKKYSTSKTLASSEGEPGESYYSKRSIRGTLEAEGDNDNYTIRKSIKSTLEGSGLEPSETNDALSYSTKRSLGTDLGSKYSRRSVSAEGSESGSRYSIRSVSREAADGTEELINKYSKKYSDKRNIGEEEEDVYAKFSRKYSRAESAEAKSGVDDETSSRQSRRLSRKESIEPKNLDDDPYEKYARKYLRNQEESTESKSYSSSKRNLAEEEEYSTKYSKAESNYRPQRGDLGKLIVLILFLV